MKDWPVVVEGLPVAIQAINQIAPASSPTQELSAWGVGKPVNGLNQTAVVFPQNQP